MIDSSQPYDRFSPTSQGGPAGGAKTFSDLGPPPKLHTLKSTGHNLGWRSPFWTLVRAVGKAAVSAFQRLKPVSRTEATI